MVKITVGQHVFNTKNAALHYYRKYINSIENGIYDTDTECFLELMQLFKNHPDYEKKIGSKNVCGIEVRTNEWNKTAKDLWLLYEDEWDKMERISWRYCIRSPPTDKMNVTTILRHAIHDHILSFRKSQKDQRCQLCLSNESIEVDHHEPKFHSIRDDWLDDDKFSCILLNGENSKWIQDWKEYHNHVCNLRFLCRGCNQIYK